MKNKQFVVLGLGRFGWSAAVELYERGVDVMAVDSDAARIDAIQGLVTHAIQADVTDPEALRELSLQDFDVAIVAIGTDLKASSVLTMMLKEMRVPYVVAKAQDEMHGRMLRKLGADRIIYAEHEMGKRVANSLLSGNILDYIELSDDVAMVEVAPLAAWLNRPLGELNLRRKPGINVIAIRSNGEIRVSLDADTIIRSGDLLLVVGEQAALDRMNRMS